MTYQIGFSERSFAPPDGKAMGGYSPLRNATGSADPLFAKTVCFSNEAAKELLIFIVFDLAAVDHLIRQAILERVRPVWPDWQISLHLFATHTHAGPAGTLQTTSGLKAGLAPIFGKTDPQIIALCAEAGSASVQAAMQGREPFTYGVGRQEVGGIGADRNDPKRAGDQRLTAFTFQTRSGRRLLLWHYACHPTILHQENTLYSADLPGAVAHNLQEFEVVIFINGNCGNISTRFTRQASSFAEVERMGGLLAQAIRKAVVPAERLLQGLGWTEATVELRPNGASMFLPPNPTDLLPVAYGIIWLDGQPLILAPAELTSEVTKPAREEQNALFLCYCDDYLFYFADEGCFREGTYEAQSSLIAPGEAERFIRAIQQQL